MTLAAQLAIGRLFRLMSRPFQTGDIEQYEVCREIIMAEAEADRLNVVDHAPNYARDRLKGAEGD